MTKKSSRQHIPHSPPAGCSLVGWEACSLWRQDLQMWLTHFMPWGSSVTLVLGH